MSTAHQTLGTRVSFGETEDTLVLAAEGNSVTFNSNLEVRSFSKNRRPKKNEAVNTKNRFKGFLVEMDAEQARVCLVKNGQKYFYDFPAHHLRKAGVTLQNQPFEMDEFEMQTPDGGFAAGHKFKPLAEKQHAYTEVLKIDEDRKRKKELILKAFAKS
jgi:hypothetical protein